MAGEQPVNPKNQSNNTPGSRLKLRSEQSRHHSFVRFMNKSNRNADVIWFNYEGQGVKYKTLLPSQAVDVNTFVGHPWVFRDHDTGDRLVVHQQDVFTPEGYNPGERWPLVRRNIFITVPVTTLYDACLRRVRNLTYNVPMVQILELQEYIPQRIVHELIQNHRMAAIYRRMARNSYYGTSCSSNGIVPFNGGDDHVAIEASSSNEGGEEPPESSSEQSTENVEGASKNGSASTSSREQLLGTSSGSNAAASTSPQQYNVQAAMAHCEMSLWQKHGKNSPKRSALPLNSRNLPPGVSGSVGVAARISIMSPCSVSTTSPTNTPSPTSQAPPTHHGHHEDSSSTEAATGQPQGLGLLSTCFAQATSTHTSNTHKVDDEEASTSSLALNNNDTSTGRALGAESSKELVEQDDTFSLALGSNSTRFAHSRVREEGEQGSAPTLALNCSITSDSQRGCQFNESKNDDNTYIEDHAGYAILRLKTRKEMKSIAYLSQDQSSHSVDSTTSLDNIKLKRTNGEACESYPPSTVTSSSALIDVGDDENGRNDADLVVGKVQDQHEAGCDSNNLSAAGGNVTSSTNEHVYSEGESNSTNEEEEDKFDDSGSMLDLPPIEGEDIDEEEALAESSPLRMSIADHQRLGRRRRRDRCPAEDNNNCDLFKARERRRQGGVGEQDDNNVDDDVYLNDTVASDSGGSFD